MEITFKSGDSPYAIAKRHNIPVERVMKSLPKKYQDKPTTIPVGLRIDLPLEHVEVQKGDTLWDISQKTGVPLQELMKRVPESVRKDPRKLQPGMTINIEGTGRESPAKSQPTNLGTGADNAILSSREYDQTSPAAIASRQALSDPRSGAVESVYPEAIMQALRGGAMLLPMAAKGIAKQMDYRKNLNEMTAGGGDIRIPPHMYGETDFPGMTPQNELIRRQADMQRIPGQPNIFSPNIMRRSNQLEAGMTPNPLRRSNQVAVPAELDISKIRAQNLVLDRLYKFMSGGQ